jgi:HPt (histidine-containing phosphotransfer) domain-containing protein
LLELFLKWHADDPDRLRAAVDNPSELAKLAHGLKGSASALFANVVADQAESTEAAAAAADPDVASHAETLANGVAILLNEIRSGLSEASPPPTR